MKSIKTYGVRGLMECVYYIPVGKAKLRLNFSGGVLTAYGNTPARYTTSDPVRQAIIEHSDLFKGGKIVLLKQRVIEQDEPEPIPASSASSAPSAPIASLSPSALTPKSFPSLAEARDYLSSAFGLSPSGLTSTEKIKSAGRAHGLNITIE